MLGLWCYLVGRPSRTISRAEPARFRGGRRKRDCLSYDHGRDPVGHVIAYSEQLDRWLKYSNGHRPDIPKIESEIHRTQQLLLRLSERTPEYASSTGWVAPPTCFVADRASQVLAGPSKSDSGITGEKSPLLQCRPCQLHFLHTSPFTRRRAPFRSI